MPKELDQATSGINTELLGEILERINPKFDVDAWLVASDGLKRVLEISKGSSLFNSPPPIPPGYGIL